MQLTAGEILKVILIFQKILPTHEETLELVRITKKWEAKAHA